MLIIVSHNDRNVQVNVSQEIYDILVALGEPKRGSFAFVRDHISGLDDDGCITPHYSHIMFQTSPKYDKYLERVAAKIRPMSFARFCKYTAKNGMAEKIAAKLADENSKAEKKGKPTSDLETLFNQYKSEKLSDIKEKLAGTFGSVHAEAHNVCYANFCGWKCHLVTETDKETGRKVPSIDPENGLFTVKSVMLPFYQIRRWTTQAGEWKPVNSAVRTMINAQIDSMTKLPAWKTFSLQKGNFSSITLQNETVFGWARDCSGLDCTAVNSEDVAAIGGMTTGEAESMGFMPSQEDDETEATATSTAG